MAQQQVELRKVRDFTDNLNDTFLFLKQNFKPLFICVLGIAGVLMLTTAILGGIYQGNTASMFEAIFNPGAVIQRRPEFFTSLYFAVVLFAWLTAAALQLVIIGYMKMYEEKGNQIPSFEEVWEVFKRYFLQVTLYQVPLFILVVIGMMLCIAPGVYLAVVFAPFICVVVIEGASFNGAFNRCFTLIKDNFWLSFGVYVVIFLISWFSSGIISFIVGIITGLFSYFTTDDIRMTVSIVASVLNVFSFLFYIVLFLSVALNYYNLAERFDGTGILRRLQTLGTTATPQRYGDQKEDEEY